MGSVRTGCRVDPWRLMLLSTVMIPAASFAQPLPQTAPVAPQAQVDVPAADPTTADNSPGAQAQESDAADIVVTANRRAQSLSRVPASIVAKTQEDLDKQGIRSITDIARLTPGITFGQSTTAFGTGQSTISIRGVDSGSGIPTTGVYIDDTPIQTRTGISPSLSNVYPQVFDLDRVEVLRGPQGTLFGSGSVGGAVRFISPQPLYNGTKFYGRTEGAITRNGAPSYEIGLAGGTALVEDKLGLRASVFYRHDGGYVDRLDRVTGRQVAEDTNYQNSFSARVALGWRPTETLTITPSLFVQDLFYADGSRYELATSDRRRADFKMGLNIRPEFRKDRFVLPGLKAALDLGNLTLTSDTSYFSRRTRSASDDTSLSLAIFAGIDGAYLPGFEDYAPTTASRTRQRVFTQELRLQNANAGARFNWIVGLFYQYSNLLDHYGGDDPRLLDVVNVGRASAGETPFASLSDNPNFGVELYQGRYSVFQRNTSIDDQKAIYAQADYEVVPRVKLTAGARYTIAKYKFDGFLAGPLYATEGQNDRLETTSRDVTPKVGLSFQADRDNLFYASAAKGVRGPGVSPAVGTSCIADGQAIGFDPLSSLTIAPDSVWSYEAGAKNRLLGGKLLVDASVYRVNWSNVQTQLALPACQQQVMLNLGDAKIDGFDLALTLRPLSGLTLTGSASYVNARYTTNIPGPDNIIIRRAGEPLPVAPWSLQLAGEYVHPIGDHEAYVRADVAYSSRNDKPIDLNSPLVDPALPRAPATTLLNLRIGDRIKTKGDQEIDLSLFVNNVTNSQPVLSLYHDTLESTQFRAATFRPRTIGLTATLRQ